MTISGKITKILQQFLILNLFVTLVSLPVLVAWGLPLSWLSPFGNLIFSPFLSLFLLFSTISFFGTVCGLPFGIFDQLLEWIIFLWQWLMSLAPENSFIGFSLPAFWALLVIALLTLYLVMLAPFAQAKNRLAALIFLLCCTVAVLKASKPSSVHTQIPCTKKDMQLLHENGTTILIDHGAFAERGNPASWVQYQLVPEIIKQTGSMQIDTVVLPKPTIRACDACSALIQHAPVRALYYPKIEGNLSGSYRRAFYKMYAVAKHKEVALHCISKEREISIGSQSLKLIPQKKISYQDIAFEQLTIYT